MSVPGQSKNFLQKFDKSWKSAFVKYFQTKDLRLGYVVDTSNAYKIFTLEIKKN